MKSFMDTSEFLAFFKNRFPAYAQYAKNGYMDKSKDKVIGIFLSTPRSNAKIALGGLENTVYSELPLNIGLQWTESSQECDVVAKDIYKSFFGCADITSGNRRMASIVPLDPVPIDIGRNEKNYCQRTIRINVTYYLEEVS